MATEDKVLLHVQRAHATCPRPAEHPSLSRQGQPVSLCPTPSYTGSRVSLSPSLFIWQTRRHLAAWSRISRCGTAWNTDAWVVGPLSGLTRASNHRVPLDTIRHAWPIQRFSNNQDIVRRSYDDASRYMSNDEYKMTLKS